MPTHQEPSFRTPPADFIRALLRRLVTRRRRPVLTALIVLLVLAVGWYVVIGRPTLQRLRQVHSLGLLEVLASKVAHYQKLTGSYPEQLRDAEPNPDRLQDGFGRPILYLSNGRNFLLVAFGRDGRPDGTNYWAVRQRENPVLACRGLDSDQFVSDRGWHRRCGK